MIKLFYIILLKGTLGYKDIGIRKYYMISRAGGVLLEVKEEKWLNTEAELLLEICVNVFLTIFATFAHIFSSSICAFLKRNLGIFFA